MANKLIPLSQTGVKAVGKTHNQRNPDGTTGIPVGNVEVENGEVINDNGDGTSSIFSNRILVPNTNYTFAQYAEKILEVKGKLEKRYINEVNGISKSLENIKADTGIRTQNSLNRNAEKQTQNTLLLKSELDSYDQELVALGQLQEMIKQQQGIENTTSEEGTPQFEGGIANINTSNLKLPSYIKPNIQAPTEMSQMPTEMSQMPKTSSRAYSTVLGDKSFSTNALSTGLQFLSSTVSTLGNSILANNIANRPIPRNEILSKQSIRTKYNAGQELKEIADSERQTIDYIKNNTSNSNVGNSLIAAIGARYADAKSRIFAKKFNAEAQMEGRQASMDMQREMYNNQAVNESNMAAYNRDNYADQLRSQALNSFTDSIYNLIDSDKKQAAETLGYQIALETSPRGVSNSMQGIMNDYSNRGLFGLKPLNKSTRVAKTSKKLNKSK